MPPRILLIGASVLCCATLTLATDSAREPAQARHITWDDAAPLRTRLEAHRLTSSSFPSYVERIRKANRQRVREGDLDHLVFYLLQSTRFTTLPAIEPALSAKALADGLTATERKAFLGGGQVAPARVAQPVRSRVTALIRALDSSEREPRLDYFRDLVTATFPARARRQAAILREYVRVMRFVYNKEFVAQRSGPEAVAELYRARGLSTDTEVEAGYLVYLGLGVAKALEPGRRIRRVLIVGPGLDLAPRTALLEAGPPESYQPWAVMDALVSLGLSRVGDLEIVGADINPRVVSHLRRARIIPPVLTLVSGIREDETVTLSAEYRDYFTQLGRSIGEVQRRTRDSTDGASTALSAGASTALSAGASTVLGAAPSTALRAGPSTALRAGPSTALSAGHLGKMVQVNPEAARALDARTLDIVTDRLEGPAFDLVIATNILPYFDDVELMLAMSNVAGMLAPGGVFLHNEPRPLVGELTRELGLPLAQSRTAVIATVRGSTAPLYDSVFIHVKAGASPVR